MLAAAVSVGLLVSGGLSGAVAADATDAAPASADAEDAADAAPATVADDGTGGEQPFGTLFAYNKVHEMGAFQLQSSAWFTSRATLTRTEGLVCFNIPRAAINFVRQGTPRRRAPSQCQRLTPPPPHPLPPE